MQSFWLCHLCSQPLCHGVLHCFLNDKETEVKTIFYSVQRLWKFVSAMECSHPHMNVFRHLFIAYRLPDNHAGGKTNTDMSLQSFWKVNKLNKNHSDVCEDYAR